MHFYYITRGIKQDVDHTNMFLQGKMFNFPYLDEAGNPEVMQIQGSLRPIQLWEYVFPREYKDVMLRTFNLGKQEHATQWIDKYGFIMRKMLKAKPFPKKEDIPAGATTYLPNERKNVQIYGIGFREDPKDIKFPTGLTHEML